ncbi:MAG: phosphoadenosine phosphosulfate reductase family protein [Nitrospirales bacterium]
MNNEQLVHIDAGYEMPELIEDRDRICREWRFRLVVGQNRAALEHGMNHTVGRVACCTALKIEAMNQVIAEQGYSAIIPHFDRMMKGQERKSAISRHAISKENGIFVNNIR